MDIHYMFRKSPESAIYHGRAVALAVIARQEHLMTVYEVGQTCRELNIPIENTSRADLPYSAAEMKQFKRGYKDSQ